MPYGICLTNTGLMHMACYLQLLTAYGGNPIQVYNLAEGAAELALCLRPDMVPKQYGGRCTLHLDEYPAQKQLLEYVAGLQCKAQRSADASSGT